MRDYIGEKFINKRGEICEVIPSLKRHKETHTRFKNLSNEKIATLLTREYEIQTTFGSFILLKDTGNLLYG